MHTSHVAGEVEVADRPAVDAALDALHLADQLAGRGIFGAPESVPAGRTAAMASSASQSSRSSPRTLEAMCMTCE